MDLNLKGRVAVITGAGAGIGEAVAGALASEGCSVWLADRARAAATNAAAALSSCGHAATALVLDVADSESVVAAFAEVEKAAGRLDILVNAAGLLSTGPFADLPASEWDRIARVNVAGIINCVKAAMPAATRQRAGRIVNIASVSAMRGGGSVGNTIYAATKASVVALTMGLARELGPLGITVNAVAPAVADTAMTHAALTEETRHSILARIPLGRLAALSDIADLVTFLASDRAAFITGAVIPVDGGILTT